MSSKNYTLIVKQAGGPAYRAAPQEDTAKSTLTAYDKLRKIHPDAVIIVTSLQHGQICVEDVDLLRAVVQAVEGHYGTPVTLPQLISRLETVWREGRDTHVDMPVKLQIDGRSVRVDTESFIVDDDGTIVVRTRET